MSDEQERWLTDRLRDRDGSGRWRVIANQVVLSPLSLEVPEPLADLANRLGPVVAGRVLNPDQWDGYPAARRRLLEVVADEGVGPVVVLTGDIHSSWAFEVPAGGETGAPAVAVELAAPSVTSQTFASIVGPDSELVARGLVNLVEEQLPHVRWTEIRHHGYIVVSLTPERMQGDWWHVDAVDETSTGEQLVASWAAMAGEPRLREAEAPLGRRARPAPPAPPGDPDESPLVEDALLWPFGVLGAGALALGGAVLALRRRRHRED
jgi:alkaline phosphatase D